LALSAVVVGTGLGLFKLAESASDLGEAQNVVETTFKASGKAIEAWAKTTKASAGISETASTQWVGFMGAMLKSSGVSETAAEGMSEKLVQLTGDMSSFYNVDTKDMWEKLRSGISGETEPLKQLGINMSVANLQAYALSEGLKKPYKEMTQGEQTTLRYNYLMNLTKDAQGDFAKTLGTSFANQVRVAKLNIEDLGKSIGTVVLPYFLQLFKWVNEHMPQIQAIISTAMKYIGIAIKTAADFIVKDIVPALVKLYNWILPHIPQIKQLIIDNFKAMGDILKIVADYVTNSLLPVFISFWNWIQPYIPAMRDVMVSAFGIIVSILQATGGFIGTYVIPVFQSLVKWCQENFPKMKDAVMQAYNYIKPSFDTLVQSIKTNLIPIIMGLWETFKKALPGIQSIFEIVFPIIVWLIKQMLDAWNGLLILMKGAYDYLKPALDNLADLFSNVFGGIVKVIQKAKDILDWFNGTPVKDKDIKITTHYNYEGGVGNQAYGPTIPHNANGTNNWMGGLTHINELGGEIVDLPSGSRVIPHDVSMEMAKNNNSSANKTPTTIQLVLANGKAIAEFVIDDLDKLTGRKNKITGRSVGI